MVGTPARAQGSGGPRNGSAEDMRQGSGSKGWRGLGLGLKPENSFKIDRNQ